MTPWHEIPMYGLDTESGGVNPEETFIVTGCLTFPQGHVQNWLLNPGREIPAGATAVHGITTEHAREHGMNPADALTEIVDFINDIHASGGALVIFNAPYDTTLIDREVRRYLHPARNHPGKRPHRRSRRPGSCGNSQKDRRQLQARSRVNHRTTTRSAAHIQSPAISQPTNLLQSQRETRRHSRRQLANDPI
jgi:DNA polymerase III epsilon subunit-like protein